MSGFHGGAGVGAYTNSNEGKIVASAFLDNYNKIIKSIRALPLLTQSSVTSASSQNASSSVSSVPFNVGDVVKGKIDRVKLFENPDAKPIQILKLSKDDEMIYLGETENGFILISNGDIEGWVDVRFLKN